MSYAIAADLVLLIHVLLIAFIVLGCPIFLFLDLPRWRLVHLLALILTVGTIIFLALVLLTFWLKPVTLKRRTKA